MNYQVRTNRKKRDIKEIISQIPGIISGKLPDRFHIHNRYWSGVAYSLYQSLNLAFDDKASGQTDELGHSWHDITEKTKAYSRRPQQGDLNNKHRNAYFNTGTIGLLTPTQYRAWKKIFAQVLYKKLKDGLSDADAKEEAGRIAWAELKRRGAQTKIDLLGSRDLLIMRDSDRVYNSFLPGSLTTNTYRPYNRDQIYIVKNGKLEIGTKVEYAADAFEDRPLWFGDISPWVDRATKFGVERLAAALQDEL